MGDELLAVVQVQALQHPGDVALHRADLQGQALGYLGVGQALADQMADALLLWRHRVHRGPAGRCGGGVGRVAVRRCGNDAGCRVRVLVVQPVHQPVEHHVIDAPFAEDLEGRQGARLDEHRHLVSREPEFPLDLRQGQESGRAGHRDLPRAATRLPLTYPADGRYRRRDSAPRMRSPPPACPEGGRAVLAGLSALLPPAPPAGGKQFERFARRWVVPPPAPGDAREL